MAIVVLPNTITNGTVADADEVQGNDNALRDGVNNVEAAQIVDSTITNDKLADPIDIVVRAVEIGIRNFVFDGLDWITVTTSADLNYTFNAMTCYVEGVRIEVASFARLYTALRDTYLDIDTLGSITFSEVLNGASAPAQAPSTLRLAKVEAAASTITDVVLLAAVTAFPTEASIKYKYIEANLTRNTTIPTSTGSQFIFVQFRGFDNTGVFVMDTTETGVTIDLGNKEVPNGFDQLGNPSTNAVLHIYVIASADGSQPIAGLASAASTFGDVGASAVSFPPGYDIAKWVGTVWIEPEGYTLPSIQNGDETVFYGGWIRNIFAASENSKWIHKDLSPYIPLDHARQFQLTSRVTDAAQTGVGHQGITPNDATAISSTPGGHFLSNGENSGAVTWSWQICDKTGLHVFFAQEISDGTNPDNQGATAGGPRGFTITGWRYFHD